jgi:nucleotide-binding universal stress UspA family protein
VNNIILCIDGEPWTEKAVTYALQITNAFRGTLTALHVINPHLKKYADEIYAVGRDEYVNHIDKELRKEAEDIVAGFTAKADASGIPYHVIVRHGEPEEEILKETSEKAYDLIILGDRPPRSFRERLGSFNLPAKIVKKIQIPILLVR